MTFSLSALLFVYGSLKQGGKLHHELAAMGARFIGPARMQGELFHVKGESWPGAFPANSEGYIHGELYKLINPIRNLKLLDRIEGTAQGLFTRETVDVWAGNRRMRAWMYAFNHPERKADRIASGNFTV